MATNKPLKDLNQEAGRGPAAEGGRCAHQPNPPAAPFPVCTDAVFAVSCAAAGRLGAGRESQV